MPRAANTKPPRIANGISKNAPGKLKNPQSEITVVIRVAAINDLLAAQSISPRMISSRLSGVANKASKVF